MHIYLISTYRQEGRLKTEIGVSGGGHVTVLDTPTQVGDGAWHCLGLAVVGRHGALVVDNVTVTATLHTTIRTGELQSFMSTVEYAAEINKRPILLTCFTSNDGVAAQVHLISYSVY